MVRKSRLVDPDRAAMLALYDYKKEISSSFPIDIRKLAIELTRYEEDPIIDIRPVKEVEFHAGLFFLDKKNSWVIIYNQFIPNSKINFTIAHETAHYFLHRKLKQSFECSISDTEFLSSDYKQQEIEADSFASSLLVPDSSFLNFIRGKKISKDFFITCCEKYDVSLTVVLLKWIKLTFLSAALLVVRENLVLWGRSSTSAYSSGLFVKSNSKLDSVKEVLANNSYKKSISFGTDTSTIKLILFYKRNEN